MNHVCGGHSGDPASRSNHRGGDNSGLLESWDRLGTLWACPLPLPQRLGAKQGGALCRLRLPLILLCLWVRHVMGWVCRCGDQEQASALTATGLISSPNLDFGVWKNGETGGNGAKWRKKRLVEGSGGKLGEMVETGGNGQEMGGNSGHSTQDVGFGGMCLRKMGPKWEGNERKMG